MTDSAGTPLTAIAGKLMKASAEVFHVVNIKFTDESANHAYSSSSTGGRKKRVPGVKDSTGSCEVLAHSGAACPFTVGETCTLTFVAVDTTHTKAVPVIIDKIEEEYDFEEKKPIAFSISFSGNGDVITVGNV